MLRTSNFSKTYGGVAGDYGHAVQQTNDSGYIVAGFTLSFGTGSQNVYVIKTDANGDTLWPRTFRGNINATTNFVKQTYDNGYIVAGNSNNMWGGTNYLIRLDSNGDTLWTRIYGGNYDLVVSVHQTSDNGFIIGGITESFGADSADVYLTKTDSNGNILWTKIYGGGIRNEGAYSFNLTSDGGFIICGYTSSYGAGGYDFYLMRTDSGGNPLWVKTFGGADMDIAHSVEQTTDGGFIVTGSTNSFGVGEYDIYLIRADGNGNLLWSNTYGGINDDGGNCVQQTTDGGYIVAGATNSFGVDSTVVYIVRTDSNGNILWSKTINNAGNNSASSIQKTLDQGYIITGVTNNQMLFYTGDVYLIKTDSNGNSGCNENIPSTIVTAVSTIATAQSVTILSGGVVGNPQTQVGSGSSITTLCFTNNISEINNNENTITIFPNPATSEIKFQISKFKVESVVIYDVLGAKVFSKDVTAGNKDVLTINTVAFTAGIYFVSIKTKEGIETKKLIVQH
ncbi:MAG TPA: T9SS type A sorting domain-containing protein [Bacteroidia bacterium]|nr:T9SS type A sorting domain-containing protein [Bacteroidia bacterium]